MEEAEPLRRLTTDLLVEILSRVDAPTLGSAACACVNLRWAAKQEALWEELCHAAWPSTMEAEAKELVSSMPGGFAKLYADSLPPLLYKSCQGKRPVKQNVDEGPATASLHLVSFVDVYYRKKCILSRVVHHGVPVHGDTTRFLGCPFRVRASSAGDVDGEETGDPPSIPLEPKEEGGVGVLNWMLEEDMMLSWILVDVKSGRAVNLSGGRPTGVQENWPSDGGTVVRFGCAVPVEQQLLPCGAAECVITMRCQFSEAEEDCLRCTKLELQVEDAEGAQLDVCRSLAVLNRALCNRTRTRNRQAVEDGYRAYLSDRREMLERKLRQEGVAGKLCTLSAVALFLGLCVVMF